MLAISLHVAGFLFLLLNFHDFPRTSARFHKRLAFCTGYAVAHEPLDQWERDARDDNPRNQDKEVLDD